jgi:Transposase DDE domain
MIIPSSMPKIKQFFSGFNRRANAVVFLVRLMAAFIDHRGRMSAGQAAGSVASQIRHPAAIGRFLGRYGRWLKGLRSVLSERLLQADRSESGTYVLILDATDVTQQGTKTENTFSTGNRKPRVAKWTRYKKRRTVRHSCHRYVMGLLLTPSGTRIPYCLAYYTRAYCQAFGHTYRTQADLGAAIIKKLSIPAGARVVVVGDTAYEARQIRQACRARGFTWIMPANTERVLAGDKPRPKLWSLVEHLPGNRYVKIRLASQKAMLAIQRRMSCCRGGSKKIVPTFYVHQERRSIHSIGEVQIVFSTKSKPNCDRPILREHVKILLTDDLKLPAEQIVALYALRWQIELFFKELKSQLGLHQYRFQRFRRTDAWVDACLITFIYMEWLRLNRVQRASTASDRTRWQKQRTFGMATAVRQHIVEAELIQIHRYTQTEYGRRKLRNLFRTALPTNYQLCV